MGGHTFDHREVHLSLVELIFPIAAVQNSLLNLPRKPLIWRVLGLAGRRPVWLWKAWSYSRRDKSFFFLFFSCFTSFASFQIRHFFHTRQCSLPPEQHLQGKRNKHSAKPASPPEKVVEAVEPARMLPAIQAVHSSIVKP